MTIRKTIQLSIQNFLATSHLQLEMKQVILDLLHSKGKIFHENSHFTWGEFSYYISSLIAEKPVICHAAAMELLMLATDLFDDLVDGDNSQSLSPAQQGILAPALLMEALHLFMQEATQPLSTTWNCIYHTLQEASNGQWLDISITADHPSATEQHYFQMIEKKSCSFMQLIFELHSTKQNPVLIEVATMIGYTAQLANDIQDIFASNKSDLLQKKATLPIIMALKEDKGLLLAQLQRSHSNIKEIQTCIKETGAIDYCTILARQYRKKAILLLQQQYPTKQQEIAHIMAMIE
ncbi:polyprenyl synthetase family protein [Metasolibacillus meyeri]|uniref:Polyprenyl synthetase family protein n=1 Tax=Metasolibacillus meyeri TaxID=1071052 RepID=A0AAW9NWM6_9BACL|nr:polyprenyl synthetase family protein [Metasolibacillus meyeri]MEC1179934.1 polyprenyl synthetase family protein [Metasolibacillus meyeri]